MSINWFGNDGPYADFSGSDAQIFALNGMLRAIGPVRRPAHHSHRLPDSTGGGHDGIHRRARSHPGPRAGQSDALPWQVHTSIFEASLCFTEVGAITYYNTGLQAPRMGVNRFPPTSPMGVYPCRDGWLGVTVLTPQQWHAFCALLDMSDMADVPLFQTAIGQPGRRIDIIEPVMRERLAQRSATGADRNALRHRAYRWPPSPPWRNCCRPISLPQRQAFTKAHP